MLQRAIHSALRSRQGVSMPPQIDHHFAWQPGQPVRLTEFAVEVAAQAMFTIAPDGQILNANRTACERLEYPREELVGLHVADIDPLYPRESWPAHFEELRQCGQAIFPTQHRTRSGRIIDVEVSVSYFEFEGKEYCCSSVRDISEQKRAESLARLQHDVLSLVASGEPQHHCLNRLCSLVEEIVPQSLASVMLLENADHCLRFEAGPRLTDEIREAFEPLPPGLHSGSCGAAAHLKRPVLVEDTRTSPHWARLQHVVDRFNLLACWSLPILCDGGRILGTFAISHSRTAVPDECEMELLETACSLASIPIRRSKEQEELQQRHNELAHFSRVSTMGEMVTSLAHELAQPLSAILNFSEACQARLLTVNADGVDQIARYVDQICQQGRRGGKILARMRDYVRRTSPRKSTCEISRMVTEALELVAHELRHRNVEVRIDKGESVVVQVDRVQIEQVIVNLVRNAADAMESVASDRRILDIRTFFSDGNVVLEFADRGPGISEDESDQIFSAFFTTKPSGTGMGLAICRTIIEDHGGVISVSNNELGGATFRVSIPLVEQEGPHGPQNDSVRR